MITSKEFYAKLKPEGLGKRKSALRTKRELSDIKKLLNKNRKILDLGCGYGRITIPLAKQGYHIEGIDITPSFINLAREDAKKSKVKIRFKIGDIRELPYKEKSFNVLLCLWSVFIEITKEREQLKAINEMLRVLAKNGIAIIEMPKPFRKYNQTAEDFRINNGRISIGKIAGIEAMPSYRHTKKTLINLMRKAKIKRFDLSIKNFGGRERFILKFWKN